MATEYLRKTLLVVRAVIDTYVALTLAVLTGVGMYYTTRYLIGFNEITFLFYTVLMTATTSAWVVIKIYKSYRTDEENTR